MRRTLERRIRMWKALKGDNNAKNRKRLEIERPEFKEQPERRASDSEEPRALLTSASGFVLRKVF